MTIKEIANLAGVSISTVSKIVNNKDENINPKTRSRVLKIVKEYNYTPYGTVKTLTNTKTFLLGVLLRDTLPTNQLLNGILNTAAKHGYNILLFESGTCRDTELKNITALCKNKVDGVIWEPIDESSLLHEHHFSQQDISINFINTPNHSFGYNIDFTELGYTLTQKLIDCKHSKIACLLKENSRRSQHVFQGFEKCLFDNQIPYSPKMKLTSSDPALGSKILSYDMSGIVSSHFSSALNLHEQMGRLHYSIPSDLSLLSLKENDQDVISFPQISGIKIPYSEFGSYVCLDLITKCEKKDTSSESAPFSPSFVLDSEGSLGIPSVYRSKKIVVVGSINTDITFNVDLLPQIGKTTKILNSTTTLGGKGANQAIGAAKLGHEVSLIGEIGNDIDSAFIFDTLEKEKVSTQGISRDLKEQTGKAYIYIGKSGESTITILSGANGKLSPNDIQQRRHLFKNTGFCLLSTEIPVATVMEAAKTAHFYGAKNILKPAALKNLPEQLLKQIDIFIPNRKEAAVLCPDRDEVKDQAAYFLKQGIETVIITLGSQGCYLKTADVEQYFLAADFTAIDTTGGADAFISALASYLIDGYSLEKSIQIATYAAGFCISRQGVVPAMVDVNTLETHIKRLDIELLEQELI